MPEVGVTALVSGDMVSDWPHDYEIGFGGRLFFGPDVGQSQPVAPGPVSLELKYHVTGFHKEAVNPAQATLMFSVLPTLNMIPDGLYVDLATGGSYISEYEIKGENERVVSDMIRIRPLQLTLNWRSQKETGGLVGFNLGVEFPIMKRESEESELTIYKDDFMQGFTFYVGVEVGALFRMEGETKATPQTIPIKIESDKEEPNEELDSEEDGDVEVDFISL